MELISVTDLAGNTESLVGFKGLRRRRAINGDKILSFSLYPSEDNKFSFDFVKEESRIEFDGEIYIVKSLQEINVGKTYFKQVECIHEFFVRMNQKQKDASHTGSMTIQDATNFIFEGTGYQPVIVDPFYAEHFENFGKENRLSLLNKALGRYKAEITINSNQVRFRKKIGEDTDFQFRYNFNVKTFERNVDTKPLRTYIKGYGKDGLVREYTSPNKDIFGYSEAPILEDERFTTVSGLDAALKEALQDTPIVSITIDFVDLRKAGYPYIIPNEGDRVFLIYEPMNVDIEARIVEIEEEYDENLIPIRTKVTLSNKKDDFAGTLFDYVDKGFSRILDDGGKVKHNVLDDAVKIATEAIKSAQTELKFENGILAIDPTNPNNIVAFNSAGIGISRDGGQTFQEALTYEGLVASVGVIGFLSANNIRAGIMKAINNRFGINLDESSIEFYSLTGSPASTISQAIGPDGREITYWTIERIRNPKASLSIGVRNTGGSVGNNIFVDGESGNVAINAPFFETHAYQKNFGWVDFAGPINFTTSSYINSQLQGSTWTIDNIGGHQGAIFAPKKSGTGSLGTTTWTWAEMWADQWNGVPFNDFTTRGIFEARVKVVDAAFDDVRKTADRVNADSVARDKNLSDVLDRVNAESVDRDSGLQRSLDTFADEARGKISALESRLAALESKN
ncbi:MULTISPECIES: phage tail protein [Bacillus cereus group]|uniref:phage tail protein n=1 Tax=Bacillus TaxID=1386 RepID=UPI0001A1D553|nr:MULTISPECIES: phage tail spike protein [Bacillus cereus group]EEM68477.1 minor structural protein [Bacillus thuringiensis serovar andalousiensis BGSC 4AW1]MEB9630876.1 phage tail spike protein [Bacillus anthracis]